MASLLPTYQQYTAWGFTGTQTQFNAEINDAEATVNAMIPVVNVVDATDTDQVAAYQKAICAAAENLITNPGGVPVKAYTAGKVHEEFAVASSPETAARKYLCGSGLLSMWA